MHAWGSDDRRGGGGGVEEIESQSTVDALISERRTKREALRALGIDPYPMRFDRTETAAELHERYAGLAADIRTGAHVEVAGRVGSIRGHRKLVFVTLIDVSGSIQLLMSASELEPSATGVRDRLDLGDWLGASGKVVTSRRGELSVDVTSLTLLAKALRPLPDKWHGLNDDDTRYRQREVDLLVNADSRRVFDVRFKTQASLRQSMSGEGFVEVETPILQSQAGGAIARPFLTHSNALDIDLSLRIAPELFLKRLVVGGYERVFEIARNFRNEGIEPVTVRSSRRSRRTAPSATCTTAWTSRRGPSSLRPPPRPDDSPSRWRTATSISVRPGRGSSCWTSWRRPSGSGSIRATRWRRSERSARRTKWRSSTPWGSGKLIFELYDHLLLGAVLDPVFICGFPVEVSPLARHRPDDPTMADRFELVIDAKELANGYSELNVPEEQ